jgi:hypothetical protein
MVVTRAVFHNARFWLKLVQPRNARIKLVTFLVSHFEISALKSSEIHSYITFFFGLVVDLENRSAKVVTSLIFQSSIGPYSASLADLFDTHSTNSGLNVSSLNICELVGNVDSVGVSVGVDVGVPVGSEVGLSVGISVGVDVGVPVGSEVGLPVGISVGVDVGVPVGSEVGLPVGRSVGVDVGVPVGSEVG